MQKLKTYFLSLLSLILITNSYGQENVKTPLNHSVYDNWKDVVGSKISFDGKWISYEINPQDGDGFLFFYNAINNSKDSVSRGKSAVFGAESNFIAYKIVPQSDTVRKAKVKKVKKDKMPKDSLAISVLESGKTSKFANLKSFKTAAENSSWMAFLLETDPRIKPELPKDTANMQIDSLAAPDSLKIEAPKKKKTKEKKPPKQDGHFLVIKNAIADSLFVFENVKEYEISENGNRIAYISVKKDSLDTARVYIFNTLQEKSEILLEKMGDAKTPVFDKTGNYLSFIYSSDTGKVKIYDLYLWNEKSGLHKIVDTLTAGMPQGWCVSENSSAWFSNDSEQLFLHTGPKPLEPKKDTVPDDEIAKLDIWHWKDSKLQPMQLMELKKEKSKKYLAVCNIKLKNFVQLEDSVIDHFSINRNTNSKIVSAYSLEKYSLYSSWVSPNYKDFYLVNLLNGKRDLIFSKTQNRPMLSPTAKNILYYEIADSNFYIYDVKSKKSDCLTCNLNVNFYNEEFDMPMDPSPYGILSWTEDEKAVYIQDRYDIWKFDLSGKNPPTNCTDSYGRNNKIRFDMIWFDKKEQYVRNSVHLLKAFDETSKSSGFFKWDSKNNNLSKILMEPYSFSNPIKAKNAELIIWNRENFNEYRDLWISSIHFSNIKKITRANPQMEEYLWGSVELFSWKSFTGEQLQGLLYKPENFDTTKKYPVIVYFYEKNSDELHSHWTPRPSRSIINPAYYASNGYIVFIPDITYKTGYPGQSAYDAIVSGTLALSKNSFIDSDNIGLQGQSWGGYQVAYLVTRTDIYKCAMAGAPVSNMTSAYGGIRWESGSSRMFQYEKSQSRIGATLWEKPDLYIENSPIFYADKVKTPLLIMSNDNDGAVPWYQGIEMFVALRRLEKPVWLLQYNNEEHNLRNRANCKDLSVRMQDFFDHYLKNTPAPVWLKNGVPAVDKGKF
ncbi:MAG: S9 family peptidase [Bacteroidales bacterium]|nr:S9 family peptidase [Bacteroidales bacterium]